jgi:hypothetical protein
MKRFYVKGNTFEIKDKLREQFGARFDGARKMWHVAEDQWEDAQAMSDQVTQWPSGELWEECRCGREPVYMPRMVCRRCWGKNYDRTKEECHG